MSSFAFKVDPREAQYARLTLGVLATLRQAVERRVKEGLSQVEIANKSGRDKSALSRILNGRTRNLTLKTVSDILWACEFEPIEFDADPIEELIPNHVPEHLTTATARVPVQRLSASFGKPSVVPMHVMNSVY
jgi:Helix-turn-helix domain